MQSPPSGVSQCVRERRMKMFVCPLSALRHVLPPLGTSHLASQGCTKDKGERERHTHTHATDLTYRLSGGGSATLRWHGTGRLSSRRRKVTSQTLAPTLPAKIVVKKKKKTKKKKTVMASMRVRGRVIARTGCPSLQKQLSATKTIADR